MSNDTDDEQQSNIMSELLRDVSLIENGTDGSVEPHDNGNAIDTIDVTGTADKPNEQMNITNEIIDVISNVNKGQYSDMFIESNSSIITDSNDQENIYSKEDKNEVSFFSFPIRESVSEHQFDQHVYNVEVPNEQPTQSILIDSTMTNIMQADTKNVLPDQNTEHSSNATSSITSLGLTANRDEALSRVASKVNNIISSSCYENEINYVRKKLEFNILLMGAPRIGKSQLTNALTGNMVNQAKTSSSLESCTQQLNKYEVKCRSLKNTSNNQQSKVFIWDTKGIENWDDQNVIPTMFQIIDHIQPIAVIYCAAPGTFAKLHQVQLILDYCRYKNTFCAAVVTNMWSGSREARMTVKDDLEKLLKNFGPRRICEFDTDDPILKKHEVTMFGDRALCTMVNSAPFVNLDFSPIGKPIRGIDELTYCIMQSLSEDKVRGWCQAVLGNRSFWEKIHHQAHGFVLERYTELVSLADAVQSNLEDLTINALDRLFSLFS